MPGSNERRIFLSPSSIKLYLDCPKKYEFRYYTNLPAKTDFPRLLGSAVHSFLNIDLYRPIKDKSRKFYYHSLDSALKAWKGQIWKLAVLRSIRDNKLIRPDDDDRFNQLYYQHQAIGASCIQNYWMQNQSLDPPLAREKRYQVRLTGYGHTLVGIVDQIRQVPLGWIEQKRPELIKRGQLDPAYDCVAIMDLKTNRLDFDPSKFIQNPSLIDYFRLQYELNDEIQATAYTYLYQQHTGKKPIAFFWYHLRSGKIFPTIRMEHNYQTLSSNIDFLVKNVQDGQFPKHVAYQCRNCDYIKACWGDKVFYIAKPMDIATSIPQYLTVPSQVEELKSKQMRLDLRVPRQKKVPQPPVAVVDKPTSVRFFDNPLRNDPPALQAEVLTSPTEERASNLEEDFEELERLNQEFGSILPDTID